MKKRADYRREGAAYLREQGKLARSAREALDLSLGELAKQTGIPKATLHGYEAGSMDSELVARMYRDLAKRAAMAAGREEAIEAPESRPSKSRLLSDADIEECIGLVESKLRIAIAKRLADEMEVN